MVTSHEYSGLFMPLLHTIQDSSVPDDDHVDSYLTLTERLREEEDVFLSDVCKHVTELTAVFKRDISSKDINLSQAALQTLGHCLYQEQISRSFTEQQAKEILIGLSLIISNATDKGVCTRALWCIAKQNLPTPPIKDILLDIFMSTESVLKKGLQSPTVDNEVLCVIERFQEQLPVNIMKEFAPHWSKVAFSLTISSAGKVREHALSVISANLKQIVSVREKVNPWLLPKLKSALLADLTKLCVEKKELFVLKVWACIVPVLGKALHRSSVINDILKLVEQGFKNTSVSVQVESYFAWQVLIDNFAESQDVLSTPKRVNLILMPLLNSAVKERNEKVESAKLAAWWHYVCSFEHKKLLELFDKICVPLLQFVFGTDMDHISLFKLKSREGFGDLQCPPTPNTGKSICNSGFETPKITARRSLHVRDGGTPKTPSVINASFAKAAKDKLFRQGCEILEMLLSKDCRSTSVTTSHVIEANLKEIVFQSAEEFEKHAKVLICAVREALKACGNDIPDWLASGLWGNLVEQVSQLVSKDVNQMFEPYFLPLLAVAEEILEGNFVPSSTSMKILEHLSCVSPEILSHHHASLHSKENPPGSTALFIMHQMLSPKVFEDGQNSERLFNGFPNLVSSGMDAPSGQLLHVQATLFLIEKTTSYTKNKSSLWRLWSCVVESLNEYILKSNEVNQGNALEHDFSAVYLAIMVPVKEMMDQSLDQEHIRLINKDLEKLYRSFSRAAALIPSLDTNACPEGLCSKLLTNWNDVKAKDLHYISGIGNLVSVVLECMDYTITPVFTSKSPIKSPSKWAKKIKQPLGNFKSALELTRKVLNACVEFMKNKKTDECSGVLAVTLTNIVDNLSVLYQHLTGPAMIISATSILAASLSPIFSLSHQSTKEIKSNIEKAIFTRKFILKVEKLWVDILTSVQSRHGEPYSNKLLSVLSPLLEVTFVHHRQKLKNQTIQFWNSTFATAQSLEYPDSLRPVLLAVKGKVHLTLPGWNSTDSTDMLKTKPTNEVEIDEASQMTQPQGSPVRMKPLMFFGSSPKIKGSFLHKAAAAEKAISPMKSLTEPKHPTKTKATNRNTHARRKLPLSLLDDDSQDFVKIAPSPTKKRLLTEHQKEVMREKSTLPALYNLLDQSQDATFITQESLCTPSPVDDLPPLFKETVQEEAKQNEQERTSKDSDTIDNNSALDEIEQSNSTETEHQIIEIPETMDMGDEKIESMQPEHTIPLSCRETPTKNPPTTSSEEEVTSPDIIPSSQLSSADSSPSFKSLRRSVNIPVNSMVVVLNDVTEIDMSLKGIKYISPQKDNLLTKMEEKEKHEPKTDVGSKDVEDNHDNATENSDNAEVESQPVMTVKSSGRKKKVSLKLDHTSPVSGRTRRGCQLKLVTPKKQSNTETSSSEPDKESENPLEKQESCQGSLSEDTGETQDSIEDENTEKEKNIDNQNDKQAHEITVPEGELESGPNESEKTNERIPEPEEEETVNPCAHVSTLLNKDVTSSPVSHAKIKFMKPNTESPTHTSLKAFQSPAASPTTGILKRCSGRYDSPSPPNKVRRVSFALPLAQEAQNKDSTEAAFPENPTVNQSASIEPDTNPTVTTTTPSKADPTAFTVLKRRRKTPSKLDKDDTACIYPDLVGCSLPVEQILPSLTSFTWSRGLGHVVYAQNIRTIGNLSALKDYQIKNLPIRSPKVETLRTALKSFHQKTKGLKSRTALLQEKKSISQFSSDHGSTIQSIPECTELPDASECKEISKDQTKAGEGLKEKTEINKENSLPLSDDSENAKSVDSEEITDADHTEESKTGNENSIGEEDIRAEETSDDKVMPSREDDDFGSEQSVKESAPNKVSFTPPLREEHNSIDKENTNTPSRTAFTKPTLLFTPPDINSEDSEATFLTEVISKLENVEQDVDDILPRPNIETNDGTEESGHDVDENHSNKKNIEEQKDTQLECSLQESGSAITETQENQAQNKTFSECLEEMLETATPEILSRLSSEEIFSAHQNLTDLMSRVVAALQSKMASS